MLPEEVLTFWLGTIDEHGLSDAAHTARWYMKDAAFDAQVRQRFAETWSALVRGEHEDWKRAPRSLLAYVIVLDQLSRNMFRGTAQAFASDHLALGAAEAAVELGFDRALVGVERGFLYMPFEHSEELATQDRAVALFTAFRDESTGPLKEYLGQSVEYAVRHRDVIVQWGRFPHRNQLLERASTAEELAFLQQPGSSF